MPDDHDFRRPFRRSVFFWLALVAASAVTIFVTQTLWEFHSIRSRRLNLATLNATHWKAIEARIATMPLNPVKVWGARCAQHHRDLEAKYREGARKPWEPLPPDPPEPDDPTFSEMWRAAIDKPGEDRRRPPYLSEEL